MIEFTYESLPDWIQSSELCTNQLDNINIIQNHNEIIVCPERYSNFNLSIQSIDDMIRLLNVVEYWGVVKSEIPYELFDYMFNHLDCFDVIEHQINNEIKLLDLFKVVYSTFCDFKKSQFPLYPCKLMTMLKCDLIKNLRGKFELIDMETDMNSIWKLAFLATQQNSVEVLKALYPRNFWINNLVSSLT